MLLLDTIGPEPPAFSAYSSSTVAASDGCAAAGDGCAAASAAAAYASDGSSEAKAWIRLSRVYCVWRHLFFANLARSRALPTAMDGTAQRPQRAMVVNVHVMLEC